MPPEYGYSGGTARRPRILEGMLWSDPDRTERQRPAEVREAEAKLRRLGWLLPVAAVLAIVLHVTASR
ncbi:morphogenic membrane protein MmpB [Streptomyces sulphureus]|uniref:morphogenic membrane protein MmpB n=1 Tax=Streptomyces sulphureus TaxID=47758 RepID=UPI000367C61A|nr:hypothetical protein [Streptomyces sulphureus]